jgi:methylmalonyl-CoA/ethylmalonyl-CoA epimerase
MFHATAMGSSYDGLFQPLHRLFGCRSMHFGDVATPGIERRGGMTWMGDNSIELGEPLGPSSPVHRFVERFGGGMHSIALQVSDLDAALEVAALEGVRVADRPGPGLAFTRPADTAGLLFEWNENHQPDDPRSGAAEPTELTTALVEVRHMAFVAALVIEPAPTARRLGRILGARVVILDDDMSADRPEALVDLGDCVLALYPLPAPARSGEIWGAVHRRPRVIGLGLTVDDLAGAEHALSGEGVAVRQRTAEGSLILDSGVLAFPIVLTDSLLPGDPRTLRDGISRTPETGHP